MIFEKFSAKSLNCLLILTLFVTSCALLGLEEEEESTATATAAAATPTSSGSLQVGSYTYSSTLTSSCYSMTDGSITLYVKQNLSFDTSAATGTARYNMYTDSSCSTSAASSITFGGSPLPNPLDKNYTSMQVNSATFNSGATMVDVNGNTISSATGVYVAVGTFQSTNDSTSSSSPGDVKTMAYIVPSSNTAAKMVLWDGTCYDSSGNTTTTLSNCTHYFSGITASSNPLLDASTN